MKLSKIWLPIFLLAILSVQASVAQAQPKGHIVNVDGVKCKFKQTKKNESYFHSLSASTGDLVFDDPNCMEAEGLAMQVNQMMILNFITKPYAQSDAAFQTKSEQFRKGSMLQVRGVCIQSATYPAVAVVVEFRLNGKYIAGVKHAMAIQGCSK